VWADIERFGIDELIASEPDDGAVRGPRSFAVQVPELTAVGVHWHDYYELGYVLEGDATHVVNGVPQQASPGTAFLLSPADLHAIEPSGPRPLRVLNAVLHPRLVEQTLESVVPVEQVGLPWSTAALPEAAEDVRRICAETARRDAGWDVVVESALRAVVVHLARRAADGGAVDQSGPAGEGPPAHVRRALHYVERHFREPLTLAQVAGVAHLSPHWFSEQFRRTTGESFQAFLKRRRLQFARALLESTELGVTEVCHAAGFSDPSYFGRAYRDRYGVAPSGTASRVRRPVTQRKRSGQVP
jgi:AraC-like DNA-binding protein/mannose-6-phosphate isomerase-like protein (cupin superfamily)